MLWHTRRQRLLQSSNLRAGSGSNSASGCDGDGEAERRSFAAKQPRLNASAPRRGRSASTPAPAESAAGGEHLQETGVRGEPRVVLRPNSATSPRARQRHDDLAGRSNTFCCCRLGSAWHAPIRLRRGGCRRKRKRPERRRQEARRREDEEFDSLHGRGMARFLDSQASPAVGQTLTIWLARLLESAAYEGARNDGRPPGRGAHLWTYAGRENGTSVSDPVEVIGHIRTYPWNDT